MSRASRTVTAATVGSLGLLVGGLVAIGGLSSLGQGAAPTSTAAATAPTTSTAGPTARAAGTTTVISVSTTAAPTTTTNPGFADGAAASSAAEQLLTGYIESQHDVEVTDPACSEPPTGAVGETFACYALKPGDLVIALRATIGEQRLVTLELITNEMPTTTTTEPATETTEG